MRCFFIVACVVTLAGAVTACGTVEAVGRPPSAVEIARINDAVAHARGLVIEPPVDQIRVEPLAPCADGSCGQPSPPSRRPVRQIPRAIVSTDSEKMIFRTKRGDTMTLPLDAITGVRVTGANRGRSAALGAAIGAGAVAAVVGVIALLPNNLLGDDDPGAMQSSGCDATCGRFIAASFVTAMIAGAIAGAAIGAPHRFVFGAKKPAHADP